MIQDLSTVNRHLAFYSYVCLSTCKFSCFEIWYFADISIKLASSKFLSSKLTLQFVVFSLCSLIFFSSVKRFLATLCCLITKHCFSTSQMSQLCHLALPQGVDFVAKVNTDAEAKLYKDSTTVTVPWGWSWLLSAVCSAPELQHWVLLPAADPSIS